MAEQFLFSSFCHESFCLDSGGNSHIDFLIVPPILINYPLAAFAIILLQDELNQAWPPS
jgi:hypothetical protein